MRRASAAVAAIVGIFLLVQLGALALVAPFEQAGYQSVEDPTDPTNSLLYIGAILVATAVMLAAFRFDVQWAIRGFVVLAAGFVSYYVFAVLLPAFPVASVDAAPLAATGALMAALLVYPEWYVIDAAGIVMGTGAAGLFGISFGLLPAILLLAGLAVYDAISVYGTEHMLTLASGVMDLKVPVVLVVPLSLSYSYLDDGAPDPGAEASEPTAEGSEPTAEENETTTGASEPTAAEVESTDDGVEAPDPMDRDAFFVGLGDAVMPTIMVASAAFFLPASVPTVALPGIEAALPAVTAMVGTLVGLVVLMRMVVKGRPHAGLPLLNGGAIAGYLLGAVVVDIPLVEALGLAPYLG